MSVFLYSTTGYFLLIYVQRVEKGWFSPDGVCLARKGDIPTPIVMPSSLSPLPKLTNSENFTYTSNPQSSIGPENIPQASIGPENIDTSHHQVVSPTSAPPKMSDPPTVDAKGDSVLQALESLYQSHKTTIDNSKKEQLVSLCVLKFQGIRAEYQKWTKKQLQGLLHNLVRWGMSIGTVLMPLHCSAFEKD